MYLEIDEGFPTHRKTLRFCALMMDHNAFAYILRLWTWACRSCPSGDLSGMEAMDIEIATQYRHNDGKCYAALVKAGFIDEDTPGVPARLHNWANRTGGAITRMAAAAERKAHYRAHKAGKGCLPGCPFCLDGAQSTDSPRTDHGTVDGQPQDKTDPDKTSPDQTRQISPPARDPGATGLWAAPRWLEVFKAAWESANKGTFYGRGAGDGTALETLQASLEALPREGRLAAERRAPAMLAEFLADDSAKARKERWQFSYFVLLFNGLRVEKPAAPEVPQRCYWHGKGNRGPSRQPLDTCPECREEKARNRGRSSEPTPFVPLKPPDNPMTREQLAEIAAARKGPSATGPPTEPKAATGGTL